MAHGQNDDDTELMNLKTLEHPPGPQHCSRQRQA